MVSKKKLRMLLMYAVLEMGALCGVPVSPEKVQELMHLTEQAAVQVVKKESTGEPE